MNETIKIPTVSEKWFNTKIRKFNRNKINEYLRHSPRLSPATLTQYRSCLRIFACWIYDNCKNKKIVELKIRDGKAYQDWLIGHNGSSSNINVKMAAAFSYWFQCEFSSIVGRPIHPHDLRTSRATDLVVRENKPIEAVSIMMGHNSTETTQQFYVIDNHKDSDAVLL